MKKINVVVVFIFLLFQFIPQHVSAENQLSKVDKGNPAFVYSHSEEFVPLYESLDDEDAIVAELENFTPVLLLEEEKEYSLVEIVSNEGETLEEYESMSGYLLSDFLISEEEMSLLLESVHDELAHLEEEASIEEASTEKQSNEESDEVSVENEDVTEAEAVDEVVEEDMDNLRLDEEEKPETHSEEKKVKEVEAEELPTELADEEEIESTIATFSAFSMSSQMVTTSSNQQLRGIALQTTTNVVESPSSNAKVLRSYNQGHILRYSPYNSNYHVATVYLNGVAHTGYINTKDVDTVVSTQVNKEGYGLKDPTPVYSSTSLNSDILRTYNQGHLLKFKTFTTEWYEATVYIDGSPTTGYIHVNDVGNNPPVQEKEVELQGVALQAPTNVYSQTTKSSNVLRSYNKGHLLRFKEHNSQWYIATVIINGVQHTGYIHVNDVDVANGNQEQLRGVAIKDTAKVYASTSKSSAILRSYNKGHILQFRSFTSEWYQATVILNGVARTGYIHINDVGPVNQNGVSDLRGVALKSTTHVYAEASRNASSLKGYNSGQILRYRAYSASWFEATVIVNGVAQTGYIHIDDVDTADVIQKSDRGIALQQVTHVFSQPSLSSSVRRSYNQGHILQYRSFTSEWYEATVVVNGIRQTGYIHVSHVESLPLSQRTINGAANTTSTNVYTRASRNSGVLRSYTFGSRLIYRTFTSEWYEATVYINGSPQTGYIHKDDVISLQGKTIILDPGHGAHDSGGIANGMREKDVVLDISLRAETLLKNAGAEVIMTRRTDIFLTLAERAAIANNSNADIFISVHTNIFDGTAQGTETFWHGRHEREDSIKLAHALQNAVISKIGTHYRRVAEGNYHVIRETTIPSALLEVGFKDHPADAAKLRSDQYRQLSAEGIYIGVLNYFQ
ncbi:N-acetylmuramoyl-L-alanine amidase [Alkalihalophilus sp. As8PL]|uniref:N-acetylmuramoyl-L-alanine amidase n=1 Tax=Alkalihalophilus sp. As8PL TaxID=3237103 RepID=A0AB39BPC7_9BACI